VIRRLFASSPRDPRYYMLEHLSSKFRTPPQASLLEPRAALILNRFTRTLTVMYATNAVSSILGVTPEQITNKSFYECIQENCLPEAIRCLESAKSNDSIAYLRFWYRDPRREEDLDREMREASQSSDSEDGGVELHTPMDIDSTAVAESSTANHAEIGDAVTHSVSPENYRTSSGESTDLEHDSSGAIFDHSQASRSSTSSLVVASPLERRGHARPSPARPPPPEPFEIEAVISCTSDGLVVILRRARPLIPQAQQILPPVQAFAPWGVNPIRPHQYQPDRRFPFQHGFEAPHSPPGGPPLDEFMSTIQNLAVFAWSLTGINGNVYSYGRGIPRGEAVPPTGLPVWDPHAEPKPDFAPPENQAAQRWALKATNSPRDGNKVPFQHHRPEEIMRNRLGVSQGPMGSERPVSSATSYLSSQPEFNSPSPGYLRADQQSDMYERPQDQSGISANPVPSANPTPTSQGQGPSDSRPVDRNLWY